MQELSCHTLILGGGPGGYIAGIKAGQLGLDTILVEGQRLGGCCLNVGCIPSKAMIHAADEFHKISEYAAHNPIGVKTSSPEMDFTQTVKWKDGIVKRLNQGVEGLLKKAGVKIINGWGEMQDGKNCIVTNNETKTLIRAQNVILATGSVSTTLPPIPFTAPQSDKVISSSEALSLPKLPERLAVIGAGYIGLELGMAFAKMGVQVTIVEATDKILPTYDSSLSKPILDRMEKLGIRLMLSHKAREIDSMGNLVATDMDGNDLAILNDHVLVTIGRSPRLQGWGMENLALNMDADNRFIKIDETCKTSMNGVYAIGDITGEPMLAHRAMAQGEMVAEILAGHKKKWDKRVIPAVCFTDPEIVQVGLTEAEAKGKNIDIIKGQFPFMANGRAMTQEDETGFVRIIARKDNHLILGFEAVGKDVSELSGEFALAIEMGAVIEDVTGTIHAHPTRSEGVLEAGLKSLGMALHI